MFSGRRPLLLLSLLGVIISLLLLSASFAVMSATEVPIVVTSKSDANVTNACMEVTDCGHCLRLGDQCGVCYDDDHWTAECQLKADR